MHTILKGQKVCWDRAIGVLFLLKPWFFTIPSNSVMGTDSKPAPPQPITIILNISNMD